MHLATVDAIRRASEVQTLALTVSYSLRYDKNFSQFTPTQNLGLCKAIVLPHFLERYIRSETDIKKMRTSLNLSLDKSCMYAVTTPDFWQIQESPLLN